jgi:hypothetical protein
MLRQEPTPTEGRRKPAQAISCSLDGILDLFTQLGLIHLLGLGKLCPASIEIKTPPDFVTASWTELFDMTRNRLAQQEAILCLQDIAAPKMEPRKKR